TGSAIGLSVALTANPLALIVGLAGLAVLVLMFLRIEWALLALVFVTYTNLSGIAIVAFNAPSIAKILFAMLLGLAVLRWALLGERPEGSAYALAILGAIGACMILSVIDAIDAELARARLIDYAKNAVLAMSITLVLVRGGSLRAVVWALLAAGLLLGGISTYQFLTGSFYSNFGGLGNAQLATIAGEVDSWRLSGPIDDPNYYGQILAVLVPLAADRVRHETSRTLRGLAMLALALCLAAILSTYS